jgi:hypothetical protein
MRYQGGYVRQGFGYYNNFSPGWYARYPGAWAAAGWVAGAAWNAASWGSCSSAVGYAEETSPIYYNYGDTVTYADDSVYYGEDVVATQEQYAQQAATIADVGHAATPPDDEKWEPLGVFAMVKGEETSSNDIFQMALSKNGVVRGNYYNGVSDTVTPISGSLDKKSQRLAWIIGDKKDTVFETGLYNLTQPETTLLAHFGKDRTEQYKLFRIEQQEDQGAAPK